MRLQYSKSTDKEPTEISLRDMDHLIEQIDRANANPTSFFIHKIYLSEKDEIELERRIGLMNVVHMANHKQIEIESTLED